MLNLCHKFIHTCTETHADTPSPSVSWSVFNVPYRSSASQVGSVRLAHKWFFICHYTDTYFHHHFTLSVNQLNWYSNYIIHKLLCLSYVLLDSQQKLCSSPLQSTSTSNPPLPPRPGPGHPLYRYVVSTCVQRYHTSYVHCCHDWAIYILGNKIDVHVLLNLNFDLSMYKYQSNAWLCCILIAVQG